jgi:hypothetical protein
MTHNDWIKRSDPEFADQGDKWALVLADVAKQTAFGWDTTTCAEVGAKLAAFTVARTAYLSDNSTENRIIRDNARAAAVSAMRLFASQFVRNNPKVRDEDKFFLGVRIPDKTSTPSAIPDTMPLSHYDLNTPRQVGVTSEDSESHHKAMPEGVRWIEHTWLVFKPGETIPEPLPDIITFDQFETWTRPSEPCILHFTEGLRRGAIAHTSRWVNTRSEPGPWAPIEVVTIP